MKLSEAILLGSTLGPQGFRAYESPDGRRCALGSALAAVGRTIEDGTQATKLLELLWPQLSWECWTSGAHYGYRCPDPFCGGWTDSLLMLIAHLNDDHLCQVSDRGDFM